MLAIIHIAEGSQMVDQGFETKSVRMERMRLLALQAPADDVDRIMNEMVRIAPLAMGSYDSNAYQSGPGIERYRPLAGAAAGLETEVRKRPGTVEVSFELPDDQQLVEQVIEAIFQAHSYEEPVIRIQTVLTSWSKDFDDSANPNRWWNTTGDWKKKADLSGTDPVKERMSAPNPDSARCRSRRRRLPGVRRGSFGWTAERCSPGSARLASP